MAYTNAVFHLDYDNGSDAARSTLTGATASNPSGTITRIHYVGHGLVTGAVVTLSSFTAWLNTTWKITKVDNDNFDLDTAVWQATADSTGNVVPFGGQSWADAWKTITSGATTARIAPGDVVRIAKSPAPTSIGNATWTNLSSGVSIETGNNLTINYGYAQAWTPNGSGDTTVTLINTDYKYAGACNKFAFDASPQASIMQAYDSVFSETNFSSYQKITFWIKNSGAITAGTLRIVLCSDTAGATPVDYFDIPAIPSINQWVPLTLARSGGGNLGASIQSVALYTNSAVTGLASKYILLQDICSCTTNGLNLQSLISKNSSEQGGTEGWYGIQYIYNWGTSIILDNHTNNMGSGRGYCGTTETVTTYIRETIKTALASAATTQVQTIQDSGAWDAGNIEFQGGYNTSNSAQDGETFFDGLNGFGYGIYAVTRTYLTFNYLNAVRYNYGFYFLTNSDNLTITNLNNSNNNTVAGLYIDTCKNVFITTIGSLVNNASVGILLSTVFNVNITTIRNINGNTNGLTIQNSSSNIKIGTISSVSNNSNAGLNFSTVLDCVIKGVTEAKNNVYGVYFSFCDNIRIFSIVTANNSYGIFNNRGKNYLFNASIGEASEISTGDYTTFADSRIFSNKHDQTADNHWIFTDGGTINSLATDRSDGTGIMWKLVITSSSRVSNYPLTLSIAKVAVAANADVTIKVWMKKDHATNVVGKLVCRGGQIAGVASDVVATKANDTNWEELTISLSGASQPTEAGVIEIEAWGYYSAGNSNVYVEDMTITQA